MYHKTYVLDLQTLLQDKFEIWARNGSSMEEIWNNFKEIVSETIKHFVPHKILRKNPDPEYYSKEVKCLKIKVRKAYNRRKLGENHLEELKRLFKQLVAAEKKTTQEAFFRSILSKEGKCWPEFYKYVKRHKGYRENIPAIKDCNGRLITDPIEKANSLNCYYSSVFSSKGNTQHIQCANSGVPFTIDTKIIR